MKFIRIFLLVLIVIGIGLLCSKKYWVLPLIEFITKNDKYEVVESSISMDEIEQMRKYKLIMQNSSEFKPFGNLSPIIFSNANGVTVSFQRTGVEARNPGSYVYINDKEIGTVEGQGLKNASFSDDQKFFNFTVYSICGAGCASIRDYKINLDTSTLR